MYALISRGMKTLRGMSYFNRVTATSHKIKIIKMKLGG
ncbi:MAG: hypothetical protein K0R06_2207 [Clostridium sp.]|jgi:hypothetical protein|nr:hypothetical protein [Clostridium sp.]